ncbi:hypothetical protein ACFL2U_01005 [Patescibacteria group bacterium]
MRLEKIKSGLWWVYFSGKVIATIHLDYLHQAETLVFHTKDEKQQRKIKELVLSHALQYVKERQTGAFGGLMTVTNRNQNLTEADSDRIMKFSNIPDKFIKLADKELDQALGSYVQVIEAEFETFVQLLNAVVADIKKNHGVEIGWAFLDIKKLSQVELEIAVAKAIITQEAKIEFFLLDQHQFTFWKSVSWNENSQDTDNLLHIVPPYHPSKKGWQSMGLINGDTDAFIGEHDHGLDYINCPNEARTSDQPGFGTWGQVNHPYYAQGKSAKMRISTTKLISQKSFDRLKKVLLAALNINNTYIAVSGGFCSPYPYPQTGNARGSEHSCVWEYRMLEKEGELPASIIPPWFHQEGWLERYANL